jgi:hypothetical protein
MTTRRRLAGRHRRGRAPLRCVGQDGAPLRIARPASAGGRTDSGYRQYTEADVHTLRFIGRARSLGFSMAEIRELVGLWQDRRRASASVKRIAQRHIDELASASPPCRPCSARCNRWCQCCHGDQPAGLPDPGRPGRHAT